MSREAILATAAPPDQAERDRALELDINVLAIAPAGSGKTSLLVARMLKCLAVSNEPEEVVAITFTRKAAAEIRARLVQALGAARGDARGDSGHDALIRSLARDALARSDERGWHLLENPNRLRAVTIDALNAELAAGLPLLSGLGGPVGITEDARALFEEAVESLFAELEDEKLPPAERDAIHTVLRWGDNRIDALREPLCDMLEKREQWLDHIVDLLNDAGRTDAEVLGPLVTSRLAAMERLLTADDRCVLAEAWRSGSAHADDLRWAAELGAWPAATADQVELWRKIADSLITDKKLRKLVNVNHGFAARLPHTQRMNAWLKAMNADARCEPLARACVEVVRCPDIHYPTHLERQREALARVLLRLAQHLQLVFARHGQADFTEIALAARKALYGEHGFSETLDRVDRRIRHLLVDEMQDTSESQNQLLVTLTSGWTPGDGHSLFMVGDPQQSIYAFRKAEVRLFQSMWETQRLGDVPLERVTLSTNFRSTRPLIDWFNGSFGRIFPQRPDLDTGIVTFSPSSPAADAAVQPVPAVDVVPLARDDENGEAEAVACRARELLASGDSVAIIARARTHLWQTLTALRRHGVPHASQDIDPLHDVPGVRDYVHLARALWHPEDRLAWAVLLRSPLVGLSWGDMLAISAGRTREHWPRRISLSLAGETKLSAEGRSRLEHLLQTLARAEQDPLLYGDLAARAEAVWHALGGPACVEARELEDVRIAMRQFRTVAGDGELRGLTALRRKLAEVFASPSAQGVEVLTAHKAKGLEFDHVLLVGCGKTTGRDDAPLLHYRRVRDRVLLVPRPAESLPEDDPAHRLYDFMERLQRQAGQNEMLRLLYVCCTRAKKSLTLFASVGFNGDGEPAPAQGSFAKLLWPVIHTAFSGLGPAGDESAEESHLRVPLAPRLPAEYRFVADDVAWRPSERRTMRPSEAVLDAGKVREEGDFYAQLVGTMYHDAMCRIAGDGLQHWSDAGASRRSAMASGFRHRGLPEPLLNDAVERVLALLRSTLESSEGRWLLAPHGWARAEYALAGFDEGRWISAVIDRCFRDETGRYWIIDYKAAARPLAAEEQESYLREAENRYREQLASYQRLLQQRLGEPVSCALYFPDPGRLVRISS